MKIRAEFTTSYLRRYLLMAAIGLGWAAYCAWDGWVAYPHKLKIAEAYERIEKEEGLKPFSPEYEARWEEIATANGWRPTLPGKKAEELRGLITWQYIMGAIGLAIGIPALLKYFLSRGSWVEGDESGLTTSWGQTVQFADVTRLNKARWAKKGIARAEYRDNGVPMTFVFDDFKFDRKPLGQILKYLERRLRAEQIVGGPPEPIEDANEASPSQGEAASVPPGG